MKWKEIVVDYLTFTRKERIGIMTILAIMIIVFFSPVLFKHKQGTGWQTPDTTWMAAVKKLEQKEAATEKNNPDSYQPAGRQNEDEHENNASVYQYDSPSKKYYNNPLAGKLFYFDPNTISKNGWQKLGLRDKAITTIQNYINKGGRFKKAEDLQRIYGLHKDEYETLAPYVKIEYQPSQNRSIGFADYKNTAQTKPAISQAMQYNFIEINTADTSAFIGLPGIGSKLATRIVNFRDKLGGFYAVDQIGEIFGLPDSTFQRIKQYLKLENTDVRKININTATVDELKAHPYIKWNIANPIVNYRHQHGSFSNIEDLKKIMNLTDEMYKKIAPYLTTTF